ncbi:MAG TPA: histidine kinase [Mycobacteriales bacterium]|nr:histidine kinase [Mycobacteriales bacterium]
MAEQTRHGEATVNAADLVLLDEADRAAVAAALHDGLLQELIGARLLVDLVARDPSTAAAAQRLVELREALSSAITLGRATMASLHNAGVLRQGLDAALVELSGREGAPLSMHVDAAVAHETGAAALLAYRLTEATRGAVTTTASVHVESVTNALRVVVTAAALPAELPALQRVLQRVEALGGTARCGDDVVEAWIPLDSGDPR